jgi:hypothetical protein
MSKMSFDCHLNCGLRPVESRSNCAWSALGIDEPAVRLPWAMQDAGAAAIELNIYYLPGDSHISGRDVEQHTYSIGGDASCTIRRTRTRGDATPEE